MRREDPNAYSGSYQLHLYCDQEGCYELSRNQDRGFLEVGEEHTKAKAMRVARRIGWKIHKDGTATCPYCIRLMKECR